MPKIYTSYFAQTKKLEELNIQPISVALYTPDWFNNPIMYRLVPPSFLLYDIKCNERKASEEELIKLKKEYAFGYVDFILKNQDPKHILEMINSWSCGKDVALCCFEKAGFCHRQLIAGWLNKHVNAGVTEYVF